MTIFRSFWLRLVTLLENGRGLKNIFVKITNLCCHGYKKNYEEKRAKVVVVKGNQC